MQGPLLNEASYIYLLFKIVPKIEAKIKIFVFVVIRVVNYELCVLVIGTPAEFYMYGTMFLFYCFSYIILAIVASEIYIPLFYRLKITSTYEVCGS